MIKKFSAVILIIFSVISLIVGAIYIWQGASKYSQITSMAAEEKVQIGMTEDQIKNSDVVDTMSEMQKAADTIREHRRGIAKTYEELLGTGKFDPTNPKHATYAQAINLENYLYVGMLSLGVSLSMIGIGLFMVMMAIAMLLTGLALFPEKAKLS